MITAYSKKCVYIEYFCKNNIQNVQFMQTSILPKFDYAPRNSRRFLTFVSGRSYYGRTNFCEVKKYEKESCARVRRKVV